jgi:hypothetical protein
MPPFHEAATRGWSEEELRRLAKMWGDSKSESEGGLMEPTTPIDSSELIVQGGGGADASLCRSGCREEAVDLPHLRRRIPARVRLAHSRRAWRHRRGAQGEVSPTLKP